MCTALVLLPPAAASEQPESTGTVTGCLSSASHSVVPDATVHVVGTGLQAVTGWDGCYAIDGIAPGDVVLYAVPDRTSWLQPTHSGSQRWRRDAAPITVRAGETARADITLPPGDTSFGSDPDRPLAGVRGWVSSHGGQRPAGVTVTLEHAGGTATVAPDADGHFELVRVRPGRAKLRVTVPPGSGVRLVGGFSTEYPASGTEFEVEPDTWTDAPYAGLSREARLSGRVTDHTGAPMTAGVGLIRSDGQRQPVGLSDAEGRWSVVVEPGDYEIDVSPPSSVHLARRYGGPPYDAATTDPVRGAVVHAGPGEDIEGLDVTLPRKTGVGGRVTDEAGRPLAGAFVTAFGGVSGERLMGMDPETDGDGRFLMNVTPGTFRVYAGARDTLGRWYGGSDGFAGAAPLDAAAGGRLDNLDIVLSRGGALSGRVVDSTGRPVPDIQVTVADTTRVQAALVLQPWTFSPAGDTVPAATEVTDAQGRWATGHHVRSGRYTLEAIGRMDSDWAPATYGVDGIGRPPRIVTVQAPARRSGLDIVIRRRGEPLLALTGALRPTGGVLELPIDCPAGCAVDLRRATGKSAGAAARRSQTRRAPRLLARGRAKPGTKRLRLRLNRAGRRAVSRGPISAQLRARPTQGPSRTFPIRIRRAR